jgi:N-acetyl-gamma-glutamyl-phosphate reductase
MSKEKNNCRKIAILGGSGFTGAELYKLLNRHEKFKIEFISSEKNEGKFVEKFYLSSRHTNKKSNLKFSKISDLEGKYDAIFSCLPNGVLPLHINRLLDHSKYIFNISGDYRLDKKDILNKHYPATLKNSFNGKSQYFIPEFSSVNKENNVINLPGCMASAALYTIYPLVKNDLIKTNIISDLKTGSSGGGKTSKEHPAERSHNFRPHKLFNHRHEPEVECAIESFCDKKIDFRFSAHSFDLPRGILATSYSYLKDGVSEIDVKKAFYKTYTEKPFICYLNSKGSNSGYPMVKSVLGTNFVEVGVYINNSNCVSIASTDNLIKGAAGQAIQAANIFLDVPETEGLSTLEGMWP